MILVVRARRQGKARAVVKAQAVDPGVLGKRLSAGNYSRITGAPPATARRDLVKLVGAGALLRTGERKGTRYWLPFVPPKNAE